MKVYFTASTSYNGELMPVYKKILLLLKQHRLTIVSGTQTADRKKLEDDGRLTSKQIFERERTSIDLCDFVVAETSKHSLGVGGEIVYALSQSKPVLALIDTHYEDKISPMLTGDPSDNLFVEFYNEGNLKFKMDEFITHFEKASKRKGRLIVIDGGDGSGKTTQANLLVEYLKKNKIPVKYMDFPQYYHTFHGKTVAKFLRGEFGGIDQVSPYLASLAYALDRAAVKKEMDDFLNRGGYIIANRYATSNMAHQSAKFKTDKEKRDYMKWVHELEYKIHKIPREDIVVYLHVPWEIGLYLTKNKAVRHYLQGENTDIHEKDLAYRKAVEKTYLDLTKKTRHWVQIDCVDGAGNMLTKEKILSRLLEVLKKNRLL